MNGGSKITAPGHESLKRREGERMVGDKAEEPARKPAVSLSEAQNTHGFLLIEGSNCS